MGALFCLLSHRLSQEAHEGIVGPQFEPEFADDSFAGGSAEQVLSCFRAEIRLARKYGLEFDMAKCKLYLPAGAHFTGTVQGFQDLGVQIIRGTDVEMLKTLVSGTEEFAANFCDKRSKELDETFEALKDLPQKHVALHLLRNCIAPSKIQYLARTAPKRLIGPLLRHFDARVREALSAIVGHPL